MTLDLYTAANQIPIKDFQQLIVIDNDCISTFINDPFTFVIGVMKSDSRVLGFGLIRVVNEFKMALDSGLTNTMKARTIHGLLSSAIKLSQCNEMIASITKGGDHYIQLLEKHFRFSVDPGVLMRLEK